MPTALVRGYYISGHKAPQPVLRTIILIVTKALACVYFYRQKDKRNIRISPTKNMFLCSYVLIYYPSVCNSGRNTIASLREWKTPPGDFLTPQLLTAVIWILSELDGDASHDLYAGGGKAEVVVVTAIEEVVPMCRHR